MTTIEVMCRTVDGDVTVDGEAHGRFAVTPYDPSTPPERGHWDVTHIESGYTVGMLWDSGSLTKKEARKVARWLDANWIDLPEGFSEWPNDKRTAWANERPAMKRQLREGVAQFIAWDKR